MIASMKISLLKFCRKRFNDVMINRMRIILKFIFLSNPPTYTQVYQYIPENISETVISVAVMKTKGKYEEKQRALLQVWLYFIRVIWKLCL